MANEIKIILGGDASKLTAAVKQANTSLQQLRPGAQQATFALTNLSRVAQDAPFGLIGIANNIEPLLQSFISLKRETGSSGAAFKALGASLIGPGGLILAVGLVSAAMSLLGQSFGSSKEELEGFAKAQKEANDEAGKEIARLKILTTVASDVTRSMGERKQAATELTKNLKDYNIQLTQEAALNGNVATATDKATAAILERAKARAIENRIAELSGENLQRDFALAESTEKLRKIQEKLNTELAKRNKLAPTNVRSADIQLQESFVQGLTERITALRNESSEATKEINNLLNSVKDQDITPEFRKPGGQGTDSVLKSLRQQLEGYQKQLEVTNKLREEGLLPLFRENDALELQLKILDTLKAIDAREVVIKTKPKLEIDPVLGELEIQKAFREFGERAGRAIEVPLLIRPKIKLDVSNATGSDIISPQDFDPIFKALQRAATQRREDTEIIFLGMTRGEIEKQIKDLQRSLEDAIPALKIDLKVEALTSLGEAIGNIFSGQGAEGLISAAQAFLGTIGNMLSQVGQQIIATSVLIQSLKKALASLFSNPAATLGIGLALVAAGTLIKNIKFNVPKFATGGIATGPTLGIFGEAGKEAIIPLDRLPEMLGNLNSAQTPVLLQPSIRFSGMDFQIMLERVTTKRGRLG